MEVLELNCCAAAPCLGSAQGVRLKQRERWGGWQAGQRALSCRLGPYSRFPQDLPPGTHQLCFETKALVEQNPRSVGSKKVQCKGY